MYKDGKVTSHDGSLESGKDGARFGLAMPDQVLLKAKYYQEVAPKVAMDRAARSSCPPTRRSSWSWRREAMTPRYTFLHVLYGGDLCGTTPTSKRVCHRPKDVRTGTRVLRRMSFVRRIPTGDVLRSGHVSGRETDGNWFEVVLLDRDRGRGPRVMVGGGDGPHDSRAASHFSGVDSRCRNCKRDTEFD
jgi:hypothetical protein